VVAVTGNILPDDVEEFKSAGVDKILLKPLKLSDVDDVIKGWSNQYNIANLIFLFLKQEFL